MSVHTDRLTRALHGLDRALQQTPKHQTLVELALDHAEHWTDTATRGNTERGGSTHPLDIDDAHEDQRVHRLALRALDRIPTITAELDALAYELDGLITRLTCTIDHSRLPTDPVPGCKSCARAGYWSPVYEKAPNKNLCRWCYDYHRANDEEPSIVVLEIAHRQGPRAASRYLAGIR